MYPSNQDDARLAELLLEVEAQLASGAPTSSINVQAIGEHPQIDREWEADCRCLELLDRVRRRWSPDGANGETPRPNSAALSTPCAKSGTPLGRFQIQGELGRGGLGVVYLAYDPKLRRQVALKVPRLESLVSDDMRRRFLREAEAAARLSHPQLVRVYEAGEEGAICYIAAEFCPGPTLAEWLDAQSEPVPIDAAARLVSQLSEAVQHAHSRSVLHRDIKPSNVLLTWQGDDNADRSGSDAAPAADSICPKLTDFGMAKLLESDGVETRSGALIGTPAYMAPEQARGRVRDVDARADVYALGALLYEILTARRVFQSESDVEALRRVLFDEPVAPRKLRPAIPRDLEAICLKCLAKEPPRRYNTAQELADDLHRFLDRIPTEARPLGPPELAWNWVRRHPWAAVVAVTVLLSACVLLATVIGYNGRLQNAAAVADHSRDLALQQAEVSRRLLYSADVRLAYETLKANNVVQAIEALDRQLPQPGKNDLREFAWHYLRRQCEPPTLALTGHESTVFSVDFSPDGRRLATASQDGTARVWNAATGQSVHVLRGHTSEVTSVDFAPDGSLLATGSEDHDIRIWNAESGQMIRVLKGHQDHVQAVAFSRDGKWLASGSRDTTVRIWNATTGAARLALDDDMDVIRAVAFSPSGDKLLAVDEAECLHVWETSNWTRIARETTDGDKLFALAISRDGALVAAAGRHKQINLWTATDQTLRHTQLLEGGHSEWIKSLAFSPADDTLASCGKDGVIQFWKPGNTTPHRTLLGHKNEVASVAWAPDGKRIASAGANASVRIWNLDQQLFRRYPPLPQPINAMDLSPDGSQLLTGTWDGHIQIWNRAQQSVVKSFRAHSNGLTDLQVSPDGALIASTGKGEPLTIWDRTSLQEIRQLPAAEVSSFCWSPTGRRLAITPDDTTVEIVEVDSGKVLHRFRHNTSVRNIEFTPDGRCLATTTLTSLNIWDVETQRLLYSLPEGHSHVTISNDGTLLAAVHSSSVSLIDLSDPFRCTKLITSGVDAESVAFSPDGNTLAVALVSPATISLWDCRTRHELMRTECDAAFIGPVAFSPDGRSLLTAGRTNDQQGIIWEWSIEKGDSHQIWERYAN